MKTIPSFPQIFSSIFPTNRYPRPSIRRTGMSRKCLAPFVGMVATLLLSACSLQPVPPLMLDTGSQSLSAAAQTFSTEVRPAPGRFRFLGKVEHAVIDQLEALGYTHVEEDGDFAVLIRLSRTDQFVPIMEPVESGRLSLSLIEDERTLRVGRTLNLNSIDLDFMQDEEIAERVRLFLEGLPKRSTQP